jgi:hypothetical protein
MFIQPFGYTPDSIRPMLEHLRRVKENPGGDHVYNLCIEHVANNKQDPVPWDVLDVIMEYQFAFDNLFVGSSNLRYTGPGSKYWSGVQDVAFRFEALAIVDDYARQFHERYGADHFYHFYVDFEAVANWWTDDDVRTSYAFLLSAWQDIYESIAEPDCPPQHG